MVFNYGVLVNAEARRFVDEAPATVDATYDAITREIFAQREGIAWTILDAGLDQLQLELVPATSAGAYLNGAAAIVGAAAR